MSIEFNTIKKDSTSSSDKSKKKSSSSTTSSSSAAAAAAAAAAANKKSKKKDTSSSIKHNRSHHLNIHNHLIAEAYSLGQHVSSIDSINNLNQSRAKFKSPKAFDRKRIIYSFQSSRLPPPPPPSSSSALTPHSLLSPSQHLSSSHHHMSPNSSNLSPPNLIPSGLVANAIYSTSPLGAVPGYSSSSSNSFLTYSTRRTRSTTFGEQQQTTPPSSGSSYLITPVSDNMCMYSVNNTVNYTSSTNGKNFNTETVATSPGLEDDDDFPFSYYDAGDKSAAARRSKFGRKVNRSSAATKQSAVSLATSNSTSSFVNTKKPPSSL